MTQSVLVNSAQNSSPDTIQVFYEAPDSGTGVVVGTFTATNNTTQSASYKGYIYDSTGSLLNAVIPQKIVVRDRFDLGPSIVGHLIPRGGTLRMESSTASSIAFRVTGDEI